MQKTLLLGIAAVNAIVDQVNKAAQLPAITKNQTLETIATTVGALAKSGHVQELQPTIAVIDKQITAGGLGHQQWIADFKKTIATAQHNLGNGHDKAPLTGSRRRRGAGERISAS